MFSGLTGPEKSLMQHQAFVDVNEKILLNLLKVYTDKKSTARLIYPSSRLVYKNTNLPLTEKAQLEGLSVYAVNKIACENYIKTYNSLFGVEYTIFRIAIPFGELNPACTDYGIVSKFKRQAEENGVITLYGDGSGRRTFTHIKNICQVFYNAVSEEKTKNEIFNVGGRAYSLYELALMQSKKTGAKIQYLPWPELSQKVDVSNGVFDHSKLDAIMNIDYIDVIEQFN